MGTTSVSRGLAPETGRGGIAVSEQSSEEIEADVEELLGELNEYDDIEEMLEDIVGTTDGLGDAQSFTSAFDEAND